MTAERQPRRSPYANARERWAMTRWIERGREGLPWLAASVAAVAAVAAA